MLLIGKTTQNFPFFNELMAASAPEDCVGFGLWAKDGMAIWLKSEGVKRWIGILEDGKLAIEAQFEIENAFPKSIVFAGGAATDPASRVIPDDEDHLERLVTLAKTLSASMRPVVVLSARALADAVEFEDDRASALLLQDLKGHLELLSKDGAWLPVLLKR